MNVLFKYHLAENYLLLIFIVSFKMLCYFLIVVIFVKNKTIKTILILQLNMVTEVERKMGRRVRLGQVLLEDIFKGYH